MDNAGAWLTLLTLVPPTAAVPILGRPPGPLRPRVQSRRSERWPARTECPGIGIVVGGWHTVHRLPLVLFCLFDDVSFFLPTPLLRKEVPVVVCFAVWSHGLYKEAVKARMATGPTSGLHV